MGKFSKDKRVSRTQKQGLASVARDPSISTSHLSSSSPLDLLSSDLSVQDIYYRKAKEVGYRARSAFKLLQIAKHFDIFTGVTRVVDLCAAPGGWTEVLSQHLFNQRPLDVQTKQTTNEATPSTSNRTSSATALTAAATLASTSSSATSDSTSSNASSPSSDHHSAVKIVAVDLQAMSPLPGVHVIKGDLTRTATAIEICQALGTEVDPLTGQTRPALAELVVCDGAPDVIGMHDIDESIQFELVTAAFNVTLHILHTGGAFVAKIFRGKEVEQMYALFRLYFKRVTISKPKTCRNSSIEGFIVCQDFIGLSDERRKLGLDHPVTMADAPPLTEPVPFVSCWDEEALDSDMSYPLSYTFKELQGRPKQSSPDYSTTTTATSSTSPIPIPSTYQNLTPSALPIDPPYKRSLQMKKQNKFQKQTTS